jgi:hypothetical protein
VANHQYVVVKMPFSQGGEEDAWTERINSVASQGWRLVTMTSRIDKSGTTFATFEREI